MKRCKPALIALGLILLVIASGLPARAAGTALGLVPKDAEVVIGINSRQIADSDVVQKLTSLVPQINAGVVVIENLTGVNLLKDIDRVVLFGNIADRQTGGAIIEGRINTEKLLTLLQSAPGYKATQTAGRTSYEWYDEREKTTKYGVIFDGGTIAVWNSLAAMQASLAVFQDSANSFGASPDARLIPGDAEKTALWLVLVNRLNKGPAAKYRIASILYSLTLGSAELTSALTVIPQDAADTAKWMDMCRGILAFGLLQGDPNLNYLASHGKVAPGGDGKSVIWITTVENEKLLGAIPKP